MRLVDGWMTTHGLNLASQKTKAIVLTKKQVYRDPALTLNNHVFPVCRTVRYFGVKLDTRLSFPVYVAGTSTKVIQSTYDLRLMPNIEGPSASKCKLLGTVVNSKLLYASAL
jgi:hypothetical protein